MTLQMIGCSHQTTAVEFRERIAISYEQDASAMTAFLERIQKYELVL